MLATRISLCGKGVDGTRRKVVRVPGALGNGRPQHDPCGSTRGRTSARLETVGRHPALDARVARARLRVGLVFRVASDGTIG